MRADLLRDVLKRLKQDYGLTEAGGIWLRKGKCPKCGKKELYTAAADPWVIRCGRVDKCGETRHVKELYPELFENWSERFQATEANPTAAADAYLLHARGLNLGPLRGAYAQDSYYDRDLKIGSATVRFPLPGGGWWERLIDQPGRFGKMKARFAPGKGYRGEWWCPPQLTDEALAAAPAIWIVEGIFDAASLAQRGMAAVSAMSCYNSPDLALARIAALCGDRARPELIWAFDSNSAGRGYAAKFARAARKLGWRCSAAFTQERETSKPRDWNDLHLIDAEEHPAFDAEHLAEYRWHGDLVLADSAIEKAKLITLKRGWNGFTVEHGTRTYWASVNEARVSELVADMAGDAMTKGLPAAEKRALAIDDAMSVTEIATCLIKPLYFEMDPVAREGSHYIQLDFPGDQARVKAGFSAGQVVNAPDFTKRLAALSPAAIFKGANHHLQSMRGGWADIPHVEAVYVTGYVREHGCYIFPDHAVADGKVYPINAEDYFEIGKLAVKPTSSESILDITWDGSEFRADWLGALQGTFGPRGVVALAFWFGTLFAEQIRSTQKSWPFLEVVGEAGSGKSTLLEFLWLLLGRENYEGFDPAKSTAAARARNLGRVGNLPVVLIESDRTSDERTHSKQFDWDELKTAYNGRSVRSRGVANGGMDTFEPPFRGGLVISQNEPVNASDAIMERIVSLKFTKAMQSAASRKAVDRLHGFTPEALSAFIIEAARREPEVMPAYFAAFAEHEKSLSASGVTRNLRLIKNHAQLLAALDALAKVTRMPDEVRDDAAEFIRTMCGERHVAISADHPVVQAFWEKFDYLLNDQDESIPSSVINHSRDDNLIAISLVQFEQVCANKRLDLPAPMADLKRHLKTSKFPKFITSKTVNSVLGTTGAPRILHCWVFQRAVAPKAKD